MSKRPYRGSNSSNTIKYKAPPKQEYYPPIETHPNPRSRPHHFPHQHPPRRNLSPPSNPSSRASSANPRPTLHSKNSHLDPASIPLSPRKHRRDISAASAFSTFSSLTGVSDTQNRYILSPERRSSRYPFENPTVEFSPYPYHSPKKSSQLTLSPSGHSLDSLFPNSAIKSPQRFRRREKNVSFGFLEYEVDSKEKELVSIPPPPRLNQPFLRRYPPPPPNYRLRYLKDPRQKTKTMQQENNQTEENDHSNSGHVIATDSHGVEIVYNAESENGPYSRIMRSDSNKKKAHGDKNDTPPREKTSEASKKANMITPSETQNHHSHNRSASYNTLEFNDVPGVPEAPYSPQFHSQQAGYNNTYSPHHSQHAYQYPPQSPVKGGSQKSPKREEHPGQYSYSHSPHHGYHHFAPPAFEDNYRRPSPGKRQRVSVSDGIANDHSQHQVKNEESVDHFSESERYHPHPPPESYQQRTYFSHPTEKREFYSESFDSDLNDRHKYGPPHVSKASSYPPPPSPNRYDNTAVVESSSSSYPGGRHGQPSAPGQSGDYNGYSQPSHPPRGHAPPTANPYEYHEQGYYPDSRPNGRYHNQNTRQGHPSYYYPESQPPHDDVHPLLRDYDPERDRRAAQPVDDGMVSNKQYSPDRLKADTESVATTPSLKSRSSKTNSPNKPKPSTAAKAAIAAGMTQPASASEVDFDIHNPPLEPVTAPSTEPVCSITSNVNNNDVLCGRGGGTNTQIGNRRFRSLVQEFQPTYLLCRRKEKPLIARTIVLIIRNRGGRFLKKDEGNGMLFEVGDEKAEAKTSQALREGLDVRASKSTTLMGRKKQREKKKKQLEDASSLTKMEPAVQGDDATISESPLRPQRDGPPPQHEYPQYPPPHYYYGYGNQYPPYQYGYEANPAYVSPSRKRQRAPETEQIYYPPPQYNHKGYHSYPYPHDYHYENYAPAPPQQSQPREENPMWEMDFNPPRSSSKKDDSRLKGEQ